MPLSMVLWSCSVGTFCDGRFPQICIKSQTFLFPPSLILFSLSRRMRRKSKKSKIHSCQAADPLLKRTLHGRHSYIVSRIITTAIQQSDLKGFSHGIPKNYYGINIIY